MQKRTCINVLSFVCSMKNPQRTQGVKVLVTRYCFVIHINVS